MTGKASRRLNHDTRVQRGGGGAELKLLLLEAIVYVPVINTGFCLRSVYLIYY